MRRLAILLLFALALPAAAQKKDLPDLQPIPEPPPPPAGVTDSDEEPQVTITQRGEDKVEEYRAGGKLYMIKVTPKHGVPYYLVDEHGDGVMTKKDTLTSGTRPPTWVIKRF